MEDELKAEGRSEGDINRTCALFQEVQQAVQSKLLRPMTRTQYHRVAFQIPFDATVRISLDTNLRMFHELREDIAAGSASAGGTTGDASSQNSSEDHQAEDLELKCWYAAITAQGPVHLRPCCSENVRVHHPCECKHMAVPSNKTHLHGG